MKAINLTLLVCLALATGCATTITKKGSDVQEVDADQVKGCEYLGIVEGSSSQTGVFANSGFHNAMNEVMNHAGEKGATHVVFPEPPKPRYFSELLRAKAYRCPSSK